MQQEIQTANDALTVIKDEHKHNPVGATSTSGIYATQDFLQAQINALADFIDGKRVEVNVTEPTKATAKEFVPA